MHIGLVTIQQVHESARCRDKDLNTLSQLEDLTVFGDTAVNG